MISALLYSYWSSYSFKKPLLCSTLLLITGNALYALAWDYNAPLFLLLGRFVTGLGGARAVNRRYIADAVSLERRTSASSMFVAISSVGMAFGPLSAAVFRETDEVFFGFTFNHITGMGFGMYIEFIFILSFRAWFCHGPRMVCLCSSTSCVFQGT